MSDLYFFDPREEFSVLERRLPHWTQSGVVCFVTWRTIDSIPKKILEQWRAARVTWLRRYGIDPNMEGWKSQLESLGREVNDAFYRQFSTRWHEELDASDGECLMKQPSISRIVSDALRFGDGSRYELTDYVIMPNHVHFLAAFPDENEMLAIFSSIKHYTARQINSSLGRKGKFWQQDGFDHLVRSREQFDHFREYIQDNPVKARLAADTFQHWSKALDDAV